MKMFKNFPKDASCPLCGKSNGDDYILILMDNPNKSAERVKVPAHVKCVNKLNLRHSLNSKNIKCGG